MKKICLFVKKEENELKNQENLRFRHSRFLRLRKFLLNFLIVRFLKKTNMKKYLLLIENEELWKKFKDIIDKDINTEIMDMILQKVKMKKEVKDAKK